MPPVHRLVAVGLHGADLVQRLVDIRADVADAILARARELAHAATEQDDRHDHHRHAGQHQQRELGAGDREHRQAADQQQQVAHRHRRAGADDRLEHRRVVDEPRDHVAGARHLEERRRQRQQMVEHRAPQVGGDALADPRHEVEARERRRRHHDDDAEHQRQRAVELARVARGESAVDHALQPLPHREHRRRGDDQRDRGKDDLPAIRSDERADARQRLQRGQRWNGGCGFGNHVVDIGIIRGARRTATRSRRRRTLAFAAPIVERGGPLRRQGTIRVRFRPFAFDHERPFHALAARHRRARAARPDPRRHRSLQRRHESAQGQPRRRRLLRRQRQGAAARMRAARRTAR